MNRRTLIIAGALIVLAIILLLLPSLLKKPAGTTPTNNTAQTQPVTTNVAAFPLDTAKVSTLSAQAQKEFDFAFTKAKEWRNDVAPAAVIVKYTGSIDDKNGKNTYAFVSPSLSQFYFTLTFDQAVNASGENNFQRILYFKEDYFLPANTAVMPINYWKLNYLDALKKADDLGGKNIRTDNKNYDVNLVLSAQTGAYLMWDVEYLVNGTKMFSVSINAYDGTVK
ncbi:MAG: hypothetical protein PHU42_00695 [Patescibacteria group bacterium]|nr:hypothetical protein [Patescibacteria group bacterium]